MAVPRQALIAALRARDIAALRTAVRADPAAACSPQVIGEAGRLAWKQAMVLLLHYGADLNASWRGYRPLHALIQEAPHATRSASAAVRVGCLQWMLANGANPNLTAAWPPARALLIAAFVGETAYVDSLTDAGAAVNGFVHAALGQTRQVKGLLQKDPSFAQARDDGGLTALQCCAASKMGVRNARIRQALLEAATLLLDHGADPNARTQGSDHELDVAYFAATSGHQPIFEMLLTHGADPTAALVSAAWQLETTLAELALRHGAQPDLARDGDKPLLNQLVRWGQFNQAQWLLEHGASPNIADERGWTAVHQATSRGSERMLKALLDAGGDRSRRDAAGMTPLKVARSTARPKMVALLK